MKRFNNFLLLSKSRIGAIVVVLLLLTTSCDNEQKQPSKQESAASTQQNQSAQTRHKNNQWNEVLAYYTSGTISRFDQVSVTFSRAVISEQQVGQSAAGTLHISPPVNANVRWQDPMTIVVESTELAAGVTYQATISAKGLADLSSEMNDYQFSFSTIEPSLALNINPIKSSDNGKQVNVSGSVETTERANDSAIESVINVNLGNDKLDLIWKHESDQKHHHFQLPAIDRTTQKQALIVTWDGEKLGVKEKGQRKLSIPELGNFTLLDIKPIQSNETYIELTFSEPLSKSQDLTGLVSVDEQSVKLQRANNQIKVYPIGSFSGLVNVKLDPAIKNINGFKLGGSVEQKVFFYAEKPAIRFVGKGTILPDNPTLSVPIETVNVDSFQLTAFQIYANNIGQFLQGSNLDQLYNAKRVGRYLWRKTIKLKDIKRDQWNRYSLDVSDLVRNQRGAIYRLRLSVNRGNSTYNCSAQDATIAVIKEQPFKNWSESYQEESSGWDGIEAYSSQQNMNWRDKDNPCKDAYFKWGKNISAERNFLASNIGIIVKANSNNQLSLTTTDIAKGIPLAGVKLDIQNFQHQTLATLKADKYGFATVQLKQKPFFVHAQYKDDHGYLKLASGLALPTSHFDVGGAVVKQGLKGKLYGERGVWRPGDSIHLVLRLEDKNKVLPKNHPVSVELYAPSGQLVKTYLNKSPVNGFYRFDISTDENAATGNWRAIARLGGLTFSRNLRIETVIPNHLKIELKAENEQLHAGQTTPIHLFSQWLHGAKASQLKTDVSLQLRPKTIRFDRYSDYIFSDPSRKFSSQKTELFSGKLDQEGKVSFDVNIQSSNPPASMLKARFFTRVFEKSGAFSSQRQDFDFYPFDKYVGIRLPKGDSKRNMLLTDTRHSVSIISLDSKGKETDATEVEVTLYKIDWKWWWDKSGESLAKYVSSYNNKALKRKIVTTIDGKAEWSFQINYPQWGRYLIRACDTKGQHCSGQTFYMDWPGWAGKARDQKGVGASALTLTSNKEVYEVGDTATVSLPATQSGRALISIENGSKLITQYWREIRANDDNSVAENQTIEIPISAEMSPNVYVSVHFIQPHSGKQNDLPIRMYGILPLKVTDKATLLSPVVQTESNWQPESQVTVKVSEAKGRPMTYTLAVVDEGLLGLTNFKTPNLHSFFYRKEALGISSWDDFDQVVGAYGGELERLLALGGDDSNKDKDQHKKRRFPPVVRFIGPYELASGEEKSHQLNIPNYLGAVRVMVVAGANSAYGSTDKTVTVKQPLNILMTAPRLVSPEESFMLPVNLFIEEEAKGDITLELTFDKHFASDGKSKQIIHADSAGEKIVSLPIRSLQQLGKGSITVVASNGDYRARQTINLSVRAPNPISSRVSSGELGIKEQQSIKLEPFGLAGTNRSTLEVSTTKPIRLQQHMDYLLRYPYGCLEQTTSAAFPQLYLPRLVNLSTTEADLSQNHVAAAINKLQQFQTASGSFSYWPGMGSVNEWANNYAGQFLIAARNMGYTLPANMLPAWLANQKQKAEGWLSGNINTQAYRLYVLALASKPALGAMNRLRERTDLPPLGRWLLAASYAKSGLLEAAQKLTQGLSTEAKLYAKDDQSFASTIRDQSIILQALVAMNREADVDRLTDRIANQLGSDKWFSTHSLAMAIVAYSEANYAESLAQGKSPQLDFNYQLDKQKQIKVSAQSPFWQSTLIEDSESNYGGSTAATLQLANRSTQKLYYTLNQQGVAASTQTTPASHGVSLQTEYYSDKRQPLSIDRIKQGSDIIIVTKITNSSGRNLKHIALNQMLPAAWEIHNTRMDGAPLQPELDYQDYRDDRVLSFFDIKAGQSVTVELEVNAAYLGRFFLPETKVEAMYDNTIGANTAGRWIEVVKAE